VRRIHTKEEISQHERERQIEFSAFTLMGRESASRKNGRQMAPGGRARARARAGVFAAASNIHQRAVAHSKTKQYTNLFHAGHFAAEFVCAAFSCRQALNK
jgi:hypothetical protein